MKALDSLRIWWARFRFDFWLDIYGVGRRQRRDLRQELGANLRAAAAEVGLGRALVRVGGLRRLALESRGEQQRPAWSSGVSAALVTAALIVVLFFFLSLYYAEGVIDSGVSVPVSSWLFPFVGSSVEVHNEGEAGLGLAMSPGLLPLLAAVAAFVAVAKPWRAVASRSAVGEPREGVH